MLSGLGAAFRIVWGSPETPLLRYPGVCLAPKYPEEPRDGRARPSRVMYPDVASSAQSHEAALGGDAGSPVMYDDPLSRAAYLAQLAVAPEDALPEPVEIRQV